MHENLSLGSNQVWAEPPQINTTPWVLLGRKNSDERVGVPRTVCRWVVIVLSATTKLSHNFCSLKRVLTSTQLSIKEKMWAAHQCTAFCDKHMDSVLFFQVRNPNLPPQHSLATPSNLDQSPQVVRVHDRRWGFFHRLVQLAIVFFCGYQSLSHRHKNLPPTNCFIA